MAKRTAKAPRPGDLVTNTREVADFLRAFGRQPAKPAAEKKVVAAGRPRIRNLAEARWLAKVWADEAEARAQKSNVDKTTSTTPGRDL